MGRPSRSHVARRRPRGHKRRQPIQAAPLRHRENRRAVGRHPWHHRQIKVHQTLTGWQGSAMTDLGVQRRLTTVVAADVVGYSRLIEADEAGTLAALKSAPADRAGAAPGRAPRPHRQADGRRPHREFGSVVGAVACAAAIQTRMADGQDDDPARAPHRPAHRHQPRRRGRRGRRPPRRRRQRRGAAGAGVPARRRPGLGTCLRPAPGQARLSGSSPRANCASRTSRGPCGPTG